MTDSERVLYLLSRTLAWAIAVVAARLEAKNLEPEEVTYILHPLKDFEGMLDDLLAKSQ